MSKLDSSNAMSENTQKIVSKTCQIALESEEYYQLHIKAIHQGKGRNQYMCSDCGKQFKSKNELTRHINSKCGTIKLYKCTVCDQELMTPGSLHNHMLRHTSTRSFMCRFCAKLFLTGGQLKVHERIHTDEKVFVCDICGKGFCHRQSLITHSTLHTGVKPFQCENCGNSFSCVGNLIKHRRTHADTCGLIPLTTHRVQHPATKLKIKINTPASSRLKTIEKERQLQQKLAKLEFSEKTNIKDIDHNLTNAENVSKEQQNLEVSASEPEKCLNFAQQVEEQYTADRKIDCNSDSGENNFSEPFEAYDCDVIQEDSVDVTSTDSNHTELQTQTVHTSNLNDNMREKELEEPNESHINENIAINELDTKKKATLSRQLKLVSCKYCTKTYSNPKCLIKHEKKHIPENDADDGKPSAAPYKCSCCTSSFSTKEECVTHKQEAHATVLTCQDCDKIFANKDCLRAHQKSFHKGLPRKVYLYVCEKCGKQFKQRNLLKHHEDNNCGTGPQLKCPVCHKLFSSMHTRQTHMRVHDPEKRLLCKFCGKSFRWKGQLKIHERSHTGEKPFNCLYCPKAFAYRESLLTHSTLHTGIKPYLCEACGSRFSCIGNLLKHRLTHSNSCGLWYEKNKR